MKPIPKKPKTKKEKTKTLSNKLMLRIKEGLIFIPRKIFNAAKKIIAWFNYNFTAKMTLLNGLIYLVLGSITIIIIIFITENSILEPHNNELNYNYNLISGNIASGKDINELEIQNANWDAADIDVVILNNGTTVFTNVSDNSQINTITALSIEDETFISKKHMHLIKQVKQTDGNYTVYLRKNITSDYNLLIKLKTAVFLLIPISLLIQLLTGILFGGVFLSPISKITMQTRKITRENLSTARLKEGNSTGELKELIQVFNQLLDNLYESFDTQDRFVSDASHELKTPIAVLQGYSDMLKRWGKKDEAVLDESVEAIFKETEHMKNLVEMLLFLSRTTNKTDNLKYENFFLNDLLDEIIKDTELTDTHHKISTGKMMAFTVDADREMIKQLIRILIDNALKYTPENGEIKLSCYNDLAFAYVVIQDKGIGISKEDLPHIFERFYRADKARSRGTGSGLGLSIAKKIADAHKAEIIVSSEVGLGTIVNLKMNLNFPKQIPITNKLT